MRNVKTLLVVVLFISMGTLVPAKAQLVTPAEALTVAQNWITLIIKNEGSWGGADTARVSELQDLLRGDRLLGYLFCIQPRGYIVVSVHRGLAPVKAYSAISDLDPDSKQGMAGVIRDNLAAALDRIEGTPKAQITIQGVETPSLPETDPRVTWSYLALDPESFKMGLESGIVALSYTPGRELLTSRWHQGAPYNSRCPGADGCAHCPVGCVALAGAQIMHYWAWPPHGVGSDDRISYQDTYDWTHMADKYVLSSSSPSGWMDGNREPLTQAHIDAVAELCREVGKAAGVSYGCDGSTAAMGDVPFGKDMLDAYEDHFRYSDEATFDWQALESRSNMYEQIKRNIAANRPLQYSYVNLNIGHSLVLDGWKVEAGVFLGHMNDGSSNWVDMRDLPGVEGMIREIRPKCAVGPLLNGKHVGLPTVNYAYFDQNTIGLPGLGVEYIGYSCQFLPGVALSTWPPVSALSPTTGSSVKFEGALTGMSLMSIKGTATASIKIGINGVMTLRDGGGIRFF